jgi:hypothetical protein
MAHMIQDFATTYAAMSDDELLRIASDKTNLIDQAAEVLEAEIGRRGLLSSQPSPPQQGASPPPDSVVPAQARSPRWTRGLIFAGYGIASLIFLLVVFAGRLNPEQAGRFSEAATGMCIKGTLGLWVGTELVAGRRLTIKATFIVATILYFLGIGVFSLFLLSQ